MNDLKVYGVIYKITNIKNNKVYIGQTTQSFDRRYSYSSNMDIEKIYKTHIGHKNCNSNYNIHLVRSIEKYGFDNFCVDREFDVAYSKEELDKKEEYWINFYKSIDPQYGYNKKTGGANGKPSNETLSKMSKSMMGHPNYLKSQSEESRERISKNLSGIKRSEDTKNKISKSKSNVKWSEKQCEAHKKSNTLEKMHNAVKRKVICLNNLEIFGSVTLANQISHTTKVGECCKGNRNSAGIINGEKAKWMYLDDYVSLCRESNVDIADLLNNHKDELKAGN